MLKDILMTSPTCTTVAEGKKNIHDTILIIKKKKACTLTHKAR